MDRGEREPTPKLAGRHSCDGQLPERVYGAAIDYCRENERGEFWVGNEEYESQVNYCPYCGAGAMIRPK
jgi:hypothetical protein